MTEQDSEFWRRAGYELVMRYGTPVERMEAQARVAEITAIHRQTERWLAEQRRAA